MNFAKKIISKIFNKPHPDNTFGISETSKCRSRLESYCVGYGVDLGYGGDPINKSAIRVDFPTPYASVGNYPVQLGGNAEDLYWFDDNALDYIFSSHLLEDFDNTKDVLKEWLRVIKVGGRIVTFCPDEQVYRDHCKRTGQMYNTAHKHEFFSLEYVKRIFEEINRTKIVYEKNLVDIYSWDLVVEKIS